MDDTLVLLLLGWRMMQLLLIHGGLRGLMVDALVGGGRGLASTMHTAVMVVTCQL